MYGHIHVILKDLVVSVAGSDKWKEILEGAGIMTSDAESTVLDTIEQSDEVTLALVGSTCKVLGLSADDALHVFGKHFVKFALRSGNRTFLKSIGATLPAFLANVNSLHTCLERDHPNARFPFFEGTFDPDDDSVQLVYLSTRSGLASLVVGLVEEIGLRIYGLDVSLEPSEVPKEQKTAFGDGCAAAWRVTWRNHPGGPEPLEQTMCTQTSGRFEPEPETPSVPFPVLHSSMVELMRLFRNPFACSCICEDDGGPTNRVVTIDVTDEHSGVMMQKASVLKADQIKNDPHSAEMLLFRCTHAGKVAAAWTDANLPLSTAFWKQSDGMAEDYNLSEDAENADVFVSHSWSPPENWNLVFGRDISYAALKSTMLAVIAKDVVLSRGEELKLWKEVTFWVDKACIPQDDLALKLSCIGLIERFIMRCDRICILFTWSYLERLWCVFEWACVLMCKEPRQLWLQNEMFVTEQSLPLYIECIRYFSLKRTKCFLDSDREILAKKIDECYASQKAFEKLVKATATALMARSMAFRAGRSSKLRKQFFEPWVELAEDLGFTELAAALNTCRPAEWRLSSSLTEGALDDSVKAGTGEQPTVSPTKEKLLSVTTSKYHTAIEDWFNESVSPVLLVLRKEVIKSA